MSFLFRKVEDVTTIIKSQSLTSVSIKDCTLRVPNRNYYIISLLAIIKAIFTSLKYIKIHVYEYTERMFASKLSHRDRKPKYFSKF